MLLRCESLEPPMSQLGQARSSIPGFIAQTFCPQLPRFLPWVQREKALNLCATSCRCTMRAIPHPAQTGEHASDTSIRTLVKYQVASVSALPGAVLRIFALKSPLLASNA